MARLFGREWTKRELLERVGDISQVAGVESFTYNDGVRDGVRAARVRTGGGLDYTVLLSRGMDIAQASYKGIPLAWISPTGEGHPHSFEAEGTNWLRTFYGGLVTTCGLQNVGAANDDPETGESLGIQGRISHAPAEETGAWTQWGNSDGWIYLEGTMREARVFGENLRLRRNIMSQVGFNSILIKDTVENLGFKTTPLMLLYHINLGWPLVNEETEVVVRAHSSVEPRDAAAASGITAWHRMEPPQKDYAEQVFFHNTAVDASRLPIVLVINRAAQVAVQITYSLPYLTQWKMMGQGEYVLGIEPGNCRVLGRAAERAAGRLQRIEPGEERRFWVSISVLDGAEAIAQAEAEVNDTPALTPRPPLPNVSASRMGEGEAEGRTQP